MFSLIITIIAIALVAALALATVYYGGTAFNRGASSANAAKLMNQSQQILGADRLYRVDHGGAMPPSMQALVDEGYLRTIPVAQVNGQFDAVAAGTAWSMVASPSGRAYTFSTGDVDVDSCKAVNQMSFGQDGIPNKVFTGFKTQCYGPDSTHLAIVVVADPGVLGADGSTNTELPNSPTIKGGSSPASGDWTTAPSTDAPSNGGNSGGTGPATLSIGMHPAYAGLGVYVEPNDPANPHPGHYWLGYAHWNLSDRAGGTGWALIVTNTGSAPVVLNASQFSVSSSSGWQWSIEWDDYYADSCIAKLGTSLAPGESCYLSALAKSVTNQYLYGTFNAGSSSITLGVEESYEEPNPCGGICGGPGLS